MNKMFKTMYYFSLGLCGIALLTCFVSDIGPYFLCFSVACCMGIRYMYLSESEEGREILKKEKERDEMKKARMQSIGNALAGKHCPKCGATLSDLNLVARTNYGANPLYHDNFYKCPVCGTITNKSSFL